MPDALRPQVFEAFSRERWDRDGCGMGLHLVREIMRAHGGEAELLDASHGAAFRLHFRDVNPPPRGPDQAATRGGGRRN